MIALSLAIWAESVPDCESNRGSTIQRTGMFCWLADWLAVGSESKQQQLLGLVEAAAAAAAAAGEKEEKSFASVGCGKLFLANGDNF